jgi:hypothetical protein
MSPINVFEKKGKSNVYARAIHNYQNAVFCSFAILLQFWSKNFFSYSDCCLTIDPHIFDQNYILEKLIVASVPHHLEIDFYFSVQRYPLIYFISSKKVIGSRTCSKFRPLRLCHFSRMTMEADVIIGNIPIIDFKIILDSEQFSNSIKGRSVKQPYHLFTLHLIRAPDYRPAMLESRYFLN